MCGLSSTPRSQDIPLLQLVLENGVQLWTLLGLGGMQALSKRQPVGCQR